MKQEPKTNLLNQWDFCIRCRTASFGVVQDEYEADTNWTGDVPQDIVVKSIQINSNGVWCQDFDQAFSKEELQGRHVFCRGYK